MAISNYDELAAAITSWSDRVMTDTDVANVIALAEAGLNGEIGTIAETRTLTGVASSREIDVSAYNVEDVQYLWYVPTSGSELEVEKRAPGSFPVTTNTGRPERFSFEDGTIYFDRPCASAYSFRSRLETRLGLSTGETNELLTRRPDVYLGACLVWGGLRFQNDTLAGRFSKALASFLPKAKRDMGLKNRGKLQVPTDLIGLIGTTRRGGYDGTD